MAIEDLREIGNVLYERRADGMLYPIRRLRPDTEARGIPAQDPSLLNVGGVGERLGLLNQIFNPVEAIGQSMQAGQRLTAPNMGVMDRVAALGDMLSGVAGVAGPAVAAGRAGAPAAAAVMEGLLGGSPTTQAAGDMARQFVVDESGALRLFHGSPHDFDRFSMSKIGTGEGAQAYGHGLYFAEAEDTAKAYRDNIGTGVSYKGNPIMANVQDGTMVNPIAARIKQTGESAEDAIKNLSKFYRSQAESVRRKGETPFPGGNPEKFAAEYEQMADEVLTVNPADFGTSGRMYEVNVNANPEDFLDWDKPFASADDLERFAARFDGVDPAIRKRIEDFGYTRQQMNQPMPDGNDLIREVFGGIGNDASVKATRTMSEAGVPGIRYFDQGSRGAGAGSRNYVVFDENLIEIVRKYGIAGAAAMLGISQADVAQAMQQQQQPQGLLSGAQ